MRGYDKAIGALKSELKSNPDCLCLWKDLATAYANAGSPGTIFNDKFSIKVSQGTFSNGASATVNDVKWNEVAPGIRVSDVKYVGVFIEIPGPAQFTLTVDNIEDSFFASAICGRPGLFF
jgi:hypothetical protein